MTDTVARLSDHQPKHSRARVSDPIPLAFPGSDPASDPSPSSWLTPADIDAILAVSWAAAICGLAAVGSRSADVIREASR